MAKKTRRTHAVEVEPAGLTFRDELDQLTRQHEAELERKQQELAERYVRSSRRQLQTHILEGKDEALKVLWRDFTRALDATSGEQQASSNGRRGRPSADSGKRVRRTEDDLKREAETVLGMIPEDGISARDLKAKASAKGIKITGSISDFIHNGTGKKPKTTGQKAGTAYFPPKE